MGTYLKISGLTEEINLDESKIDSMRFLYDSPDDSNAKSSTASVTIEIHGRVTAAVGGDAFDDCLKMAKWAQVPAESDDSYRTVEVIQVKASQVVRKYTLPNSFIVDFEEDFVEEEGEGKFFIKLRQKKDKINSIAIDGGYAQDE